MTDETLDFLGDYFVRKKLYESGWKFHEFIDEWQQGYIVIEQK